MKADDDFTPKNIESWREEEAIDSIDPSPEDLIVTTEKSGRIEDDLPKGLDIAKMFRQVEKSHETNLLDSLSKSL